MAIGGNHCGFCLYFEVDCDQRPHGGVHTDSEHELPRPAAHPAAAPRHPAGLHTRVPENRGQHHLHQREGRSAGISASRYQVRNGGIACVVRYRHTHTHTHTRVPENRGQHHLHQREGRSAGISASRYQVRNGGIACVVRYRHTHTHTHTRVPENRGQHHLHQREGRSAGISASRYQVRNGGIACVVRYRHTHTHTHTSSRKQRPTSPSSERGKICWDQCIEISSEKLGDCMCG